MSLGEPTSDSAPFFSDDSEAEGAEEQGGSGGQRSQEESPSGVSRVRALLTVLILCYINLLNYMDRFTVAGTNARRSPLADLHEYQDVQSADSRRFENDACRNKQGLCYDHFLETTVTTEKSMKRVQSAGRLKTFFI